MSDLISVIMPVKNGSKYIKEALNSVLAQKMKTEIIVVDDGSTDNTAEIAENMGCRVIKHDVSKGQVAAKNSGLKVANGEYVLFLDHDDVMKPDTLRRLYDELSGNDNLYMVMAKVQDFLSPDVTDKNVSYKEEPYFGLFTGAVLMRKALFDKVGLFDESVHTGEIIELQHKMTDAGLLMKKLDFTATMRRIHDTNFGRTASKQEFQNYAAILRKRLMKK